MENPERGWGGIMDDIARAVLDALDGRRRVSPFSEGVDGFGLDAAYRVSDSVMDLRIGRGEQPAGWKIGFTNRAIWDEYGVHAPIWGPVYRGGVVACDPEAETPSLDPAAFVEPRIEPEIILRIARPPRADMDDEALLGCVDAVGHGFEIVQSIFPGWRFTAADTVAACALHGALVHGPFVPIEVEHRRAWLSSLAGFEIILSRNGAEVDRGAGSNVLDSPICALRHFLAGLEARPMRRGVREGDLISTGTLTRAFPVAAGETWSTRIDGLPLPGMRLHFIGDVRDSPERWIERAAQARFRFENPEVCDSPADYEHAVSLSVEAETALSRIFLRDSEGLRHARDEVARKALMLKEGRKNSANP